MKYFNKISAELLVIIAVALFAFSGCGEENISTNAFSDDGKVESHPVSLSVLVPESPGTDVSDGDGYSIDFSNCTLGYITVTYTGESTKAKLRITAPDEVVYTYTVFPGDEPATFPLQAGNGCYDVQLYEHAYDDNYALLCDFDISVSLQNEFLPFLYPNQYVWFTPGSDTEALAQELISTESDEVSYLTAVYHYVIGNISYDSEKAENTPADYVPDNDETLAYGKGICFDYASLMASLLRCGGMPARLVMGYSGNAYHAWISVYLQESGWIDRVIEFDGEQWQLLDPTLAASNDSSAVRRYVGDGSNYIVKYYY